MDRTAEDDVHPLNLSAQSIVAVQEEIAVYEAAVASVDAELQELFRQAAVLRASKQKYLDLIGQCRGRITLALRAPDEVLATCFEHCAREWARTPLVVSQVCRKWRQAAMMPRVWSRFLLNSESRDPVAKTRLWLSRALDAPLRVSVDVEAVDEQILSAWYLLLEKSSQWHTLSLQTRLIQQTNHLLSTCENKALPRLDFVRIVCIESTGFPEEPMDPELKELTRLSTAFSNCPALRHLVVHACHFPPCYPLQITRLSLNFPTLSSFGTPTEELAPLAALSQLQQLTDLTIHAPISHYFQRPFVDEEAPMIELLQLESLTLSTYRAFNPLLKHIYAPRLRTLRIRSIEDPLTHPHAPTAAVVLSFLRDSMPPLECLELHDIDLPAEDFVRVFAAAPNLESLRLHETEIPDECLAALNGPRGLCPRLKRLDLRWCEQLAGEALVDLVASRMDATNSSPIEWVRVINSAVVKEKDVLALARMTTCSVYLSDNESESEDYCRYKGCCNNARYRQRLMLRNNKEILGDANTKPLRLVLN